MKTAEKQLKQDMAFYALILIIALGLMSTLTSCSKSDKENPQPLQPDQCKIQTAVAGPINYQDTINGLVVTVGYYAVTFDSLYTKAGSFKISKPVKDTIGIRNTLSSLNIGTFEYNYHSAPFVKFHGSTMNYAVMTYKHSNNNTTRKEIIHFTCN